MPVRNKPVESLQRMVDSVKSKSRPLEAISSVWDPLRRKIAEMAAMLERSGLRPMPLVASGFALGIGACGDLALHANYVALALFALNRLSVVLAAQMDRPSAATRSLNAILGRVALGTIPFGFALADASHALAASFVMLGIMVEGLAMGMMRGEHAVSGDAAAGIDVFALVASLALAVAIVMPGWFGIVAYGTGIVGFIVAGRAVGALVA
jgi:hypothetical protein